MPYRLTYELVRKSGGTCSGLNWRTCYRADSARAAFLSMVYDMLAADGALDTERGRAAMAKAQSCEISAPAPGYEKIWQVHARLDPDRLCVPSVTLTARRVRNARA